MALLSVLLGIVVLGAGFVKGAFGFGASSIAVPLLVLLLDPLSGVLIMIAPTLVGDLLALGTSYRGFRLDRRIWLFVVGTFLGSFAGAYTVGWLPARGLTVLVGVATALGSIVRMVSPDLALSARAATYSAPLVGALGGWVIGAAGVGAPLLALYLAALGLPRENFIAALNITFVLIDLSRIAGTGLSGGRPFDLPQVVAIVAVVVGVGIGWWVRRRRDARSYDMALNLFMTVVGLLLIYRGLTG